MKKILITGVSGLIGGLLARHLRELGGYEVTALNRRPVEDFPWVQADISDLEAIKPAFEGRDVVVHMSAFTGNTKNWEGNLSGNIIGVRNVYEAARLAGVKRVVFGSSGAAIGGISLVPPYDAIAAGRYEDVPDDWAKITHEQVRPLGIYGAAKVWGEALGGTTPTPTGYRSSAYVLARSGPTTGRTTPTGSLTTSATVTSCRCW